MTYEEMHRLAEQAYGDGWKTALAVAIGVTSKTVHRRCNGSWPDKQASSREASLMVADLMQRASHYMGMAEKAAGARELLGARS